MAQFDVCTNPNPASAKRIPYLLDVQSDLLNSLATRVVVPLATLETLGNKPAQYLNPEFAVEGRRLVMLTQEMAGVPAKRLGPVISNFAGHRAEIVRALDVVLSGL
jgi:toxin CcdB